MGPTSSTVYGEYHVLPLNGSMALTLSDFRNLALNLYQFNQLRCLLNFIEYLDNHLVQGLIIHMYLNAYILLDWNKLLDEYL